MVTLYVGSCPKGTCGDNRTGWAATGETPGGACQVRGPPGQGETGMPAAARACRMARAIAGEPGVSEWTQKRSKGSEEE